MSTTLLHSNNGEVKREQAIVLSSMTVPQLTSAFESLDECQQRYDKLSGICAIMKGLVLTEVKHKCGHGNFLPWIKEHFPKHRSVAAQDMRLAGEFFKCRPSSTFETLGRDLATTLKEIEAAQLDLKHPLVREVAKFVGDRTRYQLLLDFPGDRGGDTSGSRKKLTPAQEEAAVLAAAREDFQSAMMKLDSLLESGSWQAPSVKDAEIESSIDLLREGAKQMSAWLKIPKRERAAKLAEKSL